MTPAKNAAFVFIDYLVDFTPAQQRLIGSVSGGQPYHTLTVSTGEWALPPIHPTSQARLQSSLLRFFCSASDESACAHDIRAALILVQAVQTRGVLIRKLLILVYLRDNYTVFRPIDGNWKV